MQECWYALTLALLSPVLMMPEDAMTALDAGKIKKVSRKWDDVVPEMIALKSDGATWKEIGEIFGYSAACAISTTTHWKQKQKKEGK